MIRLVMFLMRVMRRSYGTQLARIGILVLVLLAFAASGFLYFELERRPDLTWGDAIWWAVVTMTTVGYGDLFPETAGGRYLIGFPTMLFGISILGYVLSITASMLIESREKELRGMGEVLMKDHILLIHYPGLARTRSLVEELRHDPKTEKTPIVLIDNRLELLPETLAELEVKFIKGDASKQETLERANFKQARSAIVLARDPLDPISDHHNLAVVLTLEQLHPEITSIAECVDAEHVPLFTRAGADDVICLAQFSSNLIVQETLDPGVQQVLLDLTSNAWGQQLYMVPVESMQSWQYAEVARHFAAQKILTMGLKRGRKVMLNPDDGQKVEPEDRVLCIAKERPPTVAL